MQNSRGGNRLTELEKKQKILITGAAGLVGQNLVIQLKENGYNNLTCLDKHAPNLKILASLHSDISCHEVDLFDDKDNWANLFENEKVKNLIIEKLGKEIVENFLFHTKFIDDQKSDTNHFDIEMKKGGMIIFDELSIHRGSAPKKNDRLVLRYLFQKK